MKIRLALLTLLLPVLPAAAQSAPDKLPVEPIRLTLYPTAAPSPALKYKLLPELEDQTPGNAAFLYYRAFSPDWWTNIRQPGMSEKIEKALQAPLKEINRAEVGWGSWTYMLKELDRAARREFCDWELTERIRKEGYGLPIPDIQGMREFIRLLNLRARIEMADGKLDKALFTLQTGLALGRHVGEGPGVILGLVGIALDNIMITRLEEFIQQPGAPNLYWALTNLPRPLVSFRKSLPGERLMFSATFPMLDDLGTRSLSPQQQQSLLDLLVGKWERAAFPELTIPMNSLERLASVALLTSLYPEARRGLIAQGHKPEEVDALPAVQVVLLQELKLFRQLRDDLLKWYGLPYAEARQGLAGAKKQIAEAQARRVSLGLLRMIPSLGKIFEAEVRLDRHISALRCVEAIRMYAAAHDGKLPVSLADINEVPLPSDPVTGKSFEYQVQGDKAILVGPELPGEKPNRATRLIYELKLQR